MSKPACPMCEMTDVLEHPDKWECITCGHEWERAAESDAGAASGERVVKDAHGKILADGDCVVLIKDLKLGGSEVLKGGSKSRPIRLVDGDHEISCKGCNLIGDGAGIFLFGGLTGDDHGTGVDLFRRDARVLEFPGDKGKDALRVDQVVTADGGHVDGAPIEDLFIRDLHLRHQRTGCDIFDSQHRQHELGCGCADVDADALDFFNHRQNLQLSVLEELG